MKSIQNPRRTVEAATSLVGGASLLAIAVAFGATIQFRDAIVEAPELQAATSQAYDTDGDGLPDRLEQTLGSDPYLLDTDQDTFYDAEEVARHSSPTDASSVPGSAPVSVGMAPYAEGSSVHPVVVMFAEDGNVRDADLQMGMLVNGNVTSFSLLFFMKRARVNTAPSSLRGSQVLVLDPQIRASYVHRTGSTSFFATLASGGTVASADAVNLLSLEGVLVFRRNTGDNHGNAVDPMQQGQSVGTVYEPLATSGHLPPSWSAGEICSQSLVVSGSSGAVVTQEIVSANCVSSWDSFCGPSCAGSVGTSIRVIDPAALIGG